MTTARSKLIEAYQREGFTAFYEETNSIKFKKECLTRIDDFCKVLITKGNTIELKHESNENGFDIFTVIINNEVGYLFTLTEHKFEYEIYRRVV